MCRAGTSECGFPGSRAKVRPSGRVQVRSPTLLSAPCLDPSMVVWSRTSSRLMAGRMKCPASVLSSFLPKCSLELWGGGSGGQWPEFLDTADSLFTIRQDRVFVPSTTHKRPLLSTGLQCMRPESPFPAPSPLGESLRALACRGRLIQ